MLFLSGTVMTRVLTGFKKIRYDGPSIDFALHTDVHADVPRCLVFFQGEELRGYATCLSRRKKGCKINKAYKRYEKISCVDDGRWLDVEWMGRNVQSAVVT